MNLECTLSVKYFRAVSLLSLTDVEHVQCHASPTVSLLPHGSARLPPERMVYHSRNLIKGLKAYRHLEKECCCYLVNFVPRGGRSMPLKEPKM